MKTCGIFEAKTKLSEICEEVAKTGLPVIITRRGLALVRIDPIRETPRFSLKERLAAYVCAHGADETDDPTDFEPAQRSRERTSFQIEG